MFISQADVDGGGGRQSVSTLLLSNLQEGPYIHEVLGSPKLRNETSPSKLVGC